MHVHVGKDQYAIIAFVGFAYCGYVEFYTINFAQREQEHAAI